jgi:hypothetical protein
MFGFIKWLFTGRFPKDDEYTDTMETKRDTRRILASLESVRLRPGDEEYERIRLATLIEVVEWMRQWKSLKQSAESVSHFFLKRGGRYEWNAPTRDGAGTTSTGEVQEHGVPGV